MSSQMNFGEPPGVAVWLVTLFTPAEETESLVGDLLEEFSLVASKSGVAAARQWYWRHMVNTIAHLIAAGFRAAPLEITAIAIGGFLLRWFFFRLSNPAVDSEINALLDRYRVYENVQAYLFCLQASMLIEHLLVNTLLGVVIACVAKGREMAATLTLALLSVALAIPPAVQWVAKTGDYGILWTLLHTCIFSIAIVAGGAFVRTRRSGHISGPRAT
jgi:hypothetical protein